MTDRDKEVTAAPGWDDRLGRGIEFFLGGCAAVILFLLMLVTFVDVVGREVLAAPLPGGFEITELMMAVLIFTALPATSWKEEHVVIDLLDGITPRWLARYRQVIMNLVSGGVVAVISWQTMKLAAELAGYKEVTEILYIPVAPIVYLIGVMSAVTALVFAANAWRHFRGSGQPHPGASAT
jgi:TRAP-type C4-dicarboxylate transport system permease small subunit